MRAANRRLLSPRAAMTLVGWLRQHLAGAAAWLRPSHPTGPLCTLSAESVIRVVSHLLLDELSASR